MKFLTKVNVLGENYKIITETSSKDKPILSNADGIIDFTTKEIFIATIDDGNPNNMQNIKTYEKQVIRHELIHAFLFESGLDVNSDWARNEEIVDWIAIQFPKLSNVFNDIGIT